MVFLRSKILFPCFLILLLGACPTRCEDQNQSFSYDDRRPNGPSHWGEIKPEWITCSTGRMQSPIDISANRVVVDPKLGSLNRHYKPSKATLINKGYQIELEWKESGGYICINGIMYKLIGCHWHAPSEHLINGRRFDLEIHLVHQSLNGSLTVVGMVYEIGPVPNPFISKIERDINRIVDVDEEIDIGYVDPEWINIGREKYYRYMGSLTTPPCTENVVWTVVGKVSSVSRKQVELIRSALVDEPKINARPDQPLNNRLIKLYKPPYIKVPPPPT